MQTKQQQDGNLLVILSKTKEKLAQLKPNRGPKAQRPEGIHRMALTAQAMCSPHSKTTLPEVSYDEVSKVSK